MTDGGLYEAREGIDPVVHLCGDGPLIAVLPSIGRGSAEMQPLASALAAFSYRVARVDPRGIGGSGGSSDFSLRDLADDVAGVIDRLGGGPAIVVGHAFGNWVARMAAARHPANVCGVVLAAAAARDWLRSLGTDVERCSDFSLSRDERLAALRRVFFADGNDAEPWLEGWYPDVLERQKRCVAGIALDEWWSAGEVPIFDLQATADPFRPEETRAELAEAFPGRVEFETIGLASHALPVERPLECAAAIAGWIERKRLLRPQ